MSKVNSNIISKNYFISPFSNLLEKCEPYGGNVGWNGENLTISFLSLNRVDLSIKLIDSIVNCIPDFKGTVLVIDNGSDREQLEKLYEKCSDYSLDIKVVELDKNYGVAGGRNRAIPHIKTEWVLFLDNDIYFINNPLKKIQEDISVLGCHFLNIPLLDSDGERIFALGGNLYISSYDGIVNVGGGTVINQINKSDLGDEYSAAFLSTFLFGGASVLKKDTFVQLGGFDENMFIGFEDIDFSIKIFREGYKIGNTTSISLIHDHPKPEKESDVDYEKKRFSANTLHSSALYMEEKYGFKIWDQNLIKWIEEKNSYIGNEVQISEKQELVTVSASRKPKIALILDVDYWAFGNIARQIKKNLSDTFEITIVSFSECNWNPVNLLFRVHDCDVLHFFWREMIPVFLNEDYYTNYFGDIPTNKNDFYSEFLFGKVLSTCVYDHLFLNQTEIVERNSMFNQFNYYVCSEKLSNIYQSIETYERPLSVIEDGVDPSIFYPINMERFNERNRPLVIGWVGNSEWANHLEDFKGFQTIVKPAIKELINEGYPIVEHYCDRVDGFVPHEQMGQYYKNIDILICMSKIEGTPNPVLEAMSCGVPVISTDVGIVPQVFGSLQKEFMIERNIIALKTAIIKILSDWNMLNELSIENRKQIVNWHWDKQCEKFKSYFLNIINNR